MALSERQIANLYNRLDQLRPRLEQAQRNLAAAEVAGHTRAETRTIRAEITRLEKEHADIHERLRADAKEERDAEQGVTLPPAEPSNTREPERGAHHHGGGTGMGLAEDRALLQQAAQTAQEAIGMQLGVVAKLEEATGAAAGAIQGYDNTALVEALGMLAQASEDAATTAQMITGAVNNLETYIGQMS